MRLALGLGADCGAEEATIFTNQVGKPIDASGLKRTWKGIIRDADVGHVRFHDLRHASATYQLRRECPYKWLANASVTRVPARRRMCIRTCSPAWEDRLRKSSNG